MRSRLNFKVITIFDPIYVIVHYIDAGYTFGLEGQGRSYPMLGKHGYMYGLSFWLLSAFRDTILNCTLMFSFRQHL
jgi:hypothetical protein